MATEKNKTELYFEWWLEELKEKGLVISYEREPQTFVIADPIPIYYNQNKKTKSFVKQFEIHPILTYTPDYKVVFSEKMLNKLIGIINKREQTIFEKDFSEVGSVYQNTMFYTEYNSWIKEQGNLVLYFDVKPPSIATQKSGRVSSSRDFKYVSRMMYDKHDIIVNKVVPIGTSTCLFSKTFLPKRYKFTDVSGALRKLKDYESKSKSIKEYLESRNINF